MPQRLRAFSAWAADEPLVDTRLILSDLSPIGGALMLRAGPFDEPAERLRLRESVSRLLARRLPPKRALALDREGSFDRSVWEALAQVGVLGLAADEEVGGSGGSLSDSVAVTEEVARVLLAMNERGEPALAYSAMAKLHAGETAARGGDCGARRGPGHARDGRCWARGGVGHADALP